MDSCIDTQILAKASDGSSLQHRFLVEFEKCQSMRIAIDPYVTQEYGEKMSPDRFGRTWLTKMAKTGRTVKRKRVNLQRPLVVELLNKCHFDPDDQMFVRLALATSTKRLTAEDDDYSARVKKVLAKAGLTVQNCQEGILFVQANLPVQPVSDGNAPEAPQIPSVSPPPESP